MAKTRSQTEGEGKSFGSSGFLTQLRAKWLRTVLRSRFAMGVAVTILSFATAEPIDFKLMKIWDAAETKTLRVKDRTVKYYENIRFVYQLERSLKDLQEGSEGQRASALRPESERRKNRQEELASEKHSGPSVQCWERSQ